MTVPVHARAGVLVVAAAGYGKTTVLEALAAESSQAQVMPADRLLAEFDRPGAPDPGGVGRPADRRSRPALQPTSTGCWWRSAGCPPRCTWHWPPAGR